MTALTRSQEQATLDPLGLQVQADAVLRRYYQTATVAIWIPLAQSSITGVMAGAALAALAWLANHPYPWRILAFAGFSVQLLMWSYMLARWLQTVEVMESWSPENPEPARVTNVDTLRLEIKQDNRTQILNLQIAPDKLYRAMRLVQQGRSFTERELSGFGNPLSLTEFRQLRDELIKRGFLAWRNPSSHEQGAELTVAGRHVVYRLAAMAATPLPYPPVDA